MNEREIDVSDEALQRQDEQELHEALIAALKAAGTRPLTDDERMLLAWQAGLSNDFYKEIRQ